MLFSALPKKNDISEERSQHLDKHRLLSHCISPILLARVHFPNVCGCIIIITIFFVHLHRSAAGKHGMPSLGGAKALFGELSKGVDITKGLKKVTLCPRVLVPLLVSEPVCPWGGIPCTSRRDTTHYMTGLGGSLCQLPEDCTGAIEISEHLWRGWIAVGCVDVLDFSVIDRSGCNEFTSAKLRLS